MNCLTEIFFDEAIERARALDAERKRNPSAPLKPLHGLPISLKDSFKLEGKDASIGIVSLANNPATRNSVLPNVLLSLGAVLYCKTNLGQLMIAGDTDNNLFGRTLNPRNTNMTAGGSSGGEAALVALRGSILGVGTDMGGSVRGPCSATGVYGFKPSAAVLPYAGQQSPIAPGIPVVISSAGPVATSMRACRFFLKTVMEAEPWKVDATCLRLPWHGTNQAEKRLRIGVIFEDGCFTPTPPIRRGIQESCQKLEKAGHEVIPITKDLCVAKIQQAVYSTFPLDGFEVGH